MPELAHIGRIGRPSAVSATRAVGPVNPSGMVQATALPTARLALLSTSIRRRAAERSNMAGQPAGHLVVHPPPGGPGLLAHLSLQAISHRRHRAGHSPPAHKKLVCTHPDNRQGIQSPGIGRERFPVELWQLRLIPETAQDGSFGPGASPRAQRQLLRNVVTCQS